MELKTFLSKPIAWGAAIVLAITGLALGLYFGLSSNADAGQSDQDNPKSPNVVLFLVDDMGYGDPGYMGHPTSRSPAIDKLAAESKVFTHFYVTSSVCSPSRASLLTGKYQVRTGIYPQMIFADNPHGLPTNETTIARLLKEEGYRTLIAGKWHLGVGYDGEYLPTNHGFDDYLGIPYSHDMCPCKVCFSEDKPCVGGCWDTNVSCPLYSNSAIISQPTSLPTLTDSLLAKATQFLEENAEENTPFFLFMSFFHVHQPQFCGAQYEGKSSRGSFGDGLLELDGAIDSILQTLDDLEIADDTIVWFLSDNGPDLNSHGRGGSAGPLRCGKGSTWEGGVRVPAAVRWPGRIEPGESDALLSSLELLPTIAAMTGANTSGLTLDGFDASDFLLGEVDESPREFIAMYPFSPTPEEGPHAVIYGKWKAHFYSSGAPMMDRESYDEVCTPDYPLTQHDPPLVYDLSLDPGERWNVVNDSDARLALDAIIAWRDEHMAGMTWVPSVTETHEPRSQPCCTDRYCDDYPSCCDCPANVTAVASNYFQ